MEATLLSGFIELILPKLLSLASARYNLQRSIRDDIRFLEKELCMIHGAIDEYHHRLLPSWSGGGGGGGGGQGTVLSLSMGELRDLAHHIEDCIDRFVYREQQETSSCFLRRVLRYPREMQSRKRLATDPRLLKKVLEESHQRKERYAAFAVAGQSSSSSAQLEEPSSSSSSSLFAHSPRIFEKDLVGIEVSRDELLEQLEEGQRKQLKVISVVGFPGSGKTVLAREVYNSCVGLQFKVRAWVSAPDRSSREVLLKVLDELGCLRVRDASDVGLLAVDIREYLDKKR